MRCRLTYNRLLEQPATRVGGRGRNPAAAAQQLSVRHEGAVMVSRRWRVITGVLTIAFVFLTSCDDDPATPPADNPYVIDFSGFAQFGFWVLPALYCLEPGDVLFMSIVSEAASCSVALTRVSD